MSKSSQLARDRFEGTIDELVDTDDRARGNRADEVEVERLPHAPDRARPILEQIVVAHEDPPSVARRPLGEERLVEPAGRPADVALPAAVRPLLALHDGGGVAQDGDESGRDGDVLGAATPKRQEPRQARVA